MQTQSALLSEHQLIPRDSQPLPALQQQCRPSLKWGALWVLIGNGTYSASQWLQIIITARMADPSDLGRYALAMSVCVPVFMLAGLQLRTVQAADGKRAHSFSTFLQLRLVTTTAALLFIGASCLFAADRKYICLLLLLALNKALETVADIYQGLMQQRERMDLLGRSWVWKGMLISTLFFCAFLLSSNIVFATAAAALAQAAGLVLDIRAARTSFQADFSRRTSPDQAAGARGRTPLSALTKEQLFMLLPLARQALPLGLSMMALSLYTTLPRYFLKSHVGLSGVGIFSAISYITSIGLVITTALANTVCPRMSVFAAHGDWSAFRTLLRKLLAVTLALGLASILVSALAGRTFLAVIYGHSYAQQSTVLTLAMIGGSLTYLSTVLSFAATALGHFRAQPWITALALGTLTLGLIALIPNFGLAGAAAASILGSFVSCAAFGWLVMRHTSKLSELYSLSMRAELL